MASLAESMFASASEHIAGSSERMGRVVSAGENATALALKKEQLDMNKQKLEKDKQSLKAKGVANVLDSYATLDKMKDQSQANKLRKHMLPAMIQANGAMDMFPPHIQEAMQTSPEVRLGQQMVAAKVRAGEISSEEALQQVSNLDVLLDYANIAEAQEFHIGETGKTERSKIVAEGQLSRQETGIAGKATAKAKEFSKIPEATRRRELTKLHVKFKGDGGLANASKKLSSLKEVLKDLKADKFKTGGFAVKVPFGAEAAVLASTNPELAAAISKSQAGVELRKLLGGAFTQAEADRELNRILNPRFDKAANVESLERYIKSAQEDLDNKMDEFRDIGLEGPKQKRESDSAGGEIDISEEKVVQGRNFYQQSVAAGKSPEEIFGMVKQAFGGTDEQINKLIKKFQIEGK